MNIQAPLLTKPCAMPLSRTLATAGMAALLAISIAGCGKSKSWATRDLTDLTVETPYVVGPGPDVKASLPQQVRDSMEYFETLDTGDGTNPRVMVSRMAGKPGIAMSLDGATNGAMNGGISSLGKATGETVNPKFTTSSLKIDGLEARKASYTGQAKGKSVHLDGVFVQKGQKVWQVQVITLGDSSAADIARIVDSVHIKP